jgi:hypothetical protein
MKNYGLGNALRCRPKLHDIQKFIGNIKEQKDGKWIHWIWQGSRNDAGYGHIWFNGKWEYAHRVAFLLFRRGLRMGEDVHHKCKNTLCVNPWHCKKKEHTEHAIEHNEERIPF